MNGQYKIYEVLKAQPDRWFKGKELSLIMQRPINSLGPLLSKLTKSKFIVSRRFDRRWNEYKYLRVD